MATDDTTPSGADSDGSAQRDDSPEAEQPRTPETGQQQFGQEPDAGALGQAAYQQDATPPNPYTQGQATPENPYTQANAAPQNPYTQGQPQQHDPYSQGQAQQPGAYSQGQTPQGAPYGQAAQSPYTQGQGPQDGYSQGAQAAGAYTQGAYSQGAQQPGYAPGAYPQVPTPAGYQQTAGYPLPAGGQRPPMDPKKKKSIILFSALAAAVVLLLIIGSVVINVVNGTQYGPEATVRSYLTAISQGKASQAGKLVDPGVTKDAAALLTDEVLGEAKALMKNAKVTKVSTRGDSAYAEVSYSVDGTSFDDVLELSKDGKQGVFFDKWKIDKPLLSSVYVYSSRGTTVSVNGRDVDFGKNYELAAYPASYEIGAPEGDFFEAEAQTFVAGTGSKANYESIDLELVPSEGLTKAVQEALNAHLDTCAASTTDDPDQCGMYTGATYDFADTPVMKYTVEKYPVVTVDESGKYFSTEGGKVTATATGTMYGGGAGTESYATGDDWNLAGTIVIDGDEVTLEDIY